MITREDILAAFPEIDEVQNGAWREACIAVWLEAANKSCWEKVTDAPNNLDVPEDSLVRHTRGVYSASLALAKVMETAQNVAIDYDKLRVICLLHDVCKIVELVKDETGYHRSRFGVEFPHGYYSCHLAMKHGLPEDLSAALLEHSQFIKNLPNCIEGVIQFYADMADADVCKFKHGSPLLISYCKI